MKVVRDGRYTYLYIVPDSYELLALVHNWSDEDGEIGQQAHYFYWNQVSIPREKTDIHGNLLWYGEYTAWGRLKKDEQVL